MKSICIVSLAVLCWFSSTAQVTFPINGITDSREDCYLFRNATIVVSPAKTIPKGDLLIRKGRIEAVGMSIDVPDDAVVMNMTGKTIYPSFIDLSTSYGLPKPTSIKTRGRGEQYLSNKDGAFMWNEALRPEVNASTMFSVDQDNAKAYRKAGFGSVLTHQKDGLMRGTSAFVLTGNEKEHRMIIKDQVATHFSFSKGTSTQNYPSSRMGAIALLRQTYYDAAWYAKQSNEEFNISLQQWNKVKDLPAFFEVNNRLDFLRADKIGDEFGVQYAMVGSGDEYLRIDAIKSSGASVVLPLNFPKPYDLSDMVDAKSVSVSQMKHWEMAPTNPKRLLDADVKIAFTADKLKDKSMIWDVLRKVHRTGVSEADILMALTQQPAQWIGVFDQIGSLEKGKIANLLVFSSPFIEEGSVLHQHWINGKPHVLNAELSNDVRGYYSLKMQGFSDAGFLISGSKQAPKMTFYMSLKDTSDPKSSVKAQSDIDDYKISFSIQSNDSLATGMYRFLGTIMGKNGYGKAALPNGIDVSWSAQLVRPYVSSPKEEKPGPYETTAFVTFPLSGFGFEEADLPKQEFVLFKNATVWTGEKQGVLSNTDVLIEAGKIKKIGKKLSAKGAVVIDATGKHLTAGIIDEHSHICINYGVNEGTQVSSAEVRIGDVINSEDINMYRQLAGGVVAAQLLHGSANPIGGQSALIKFRWGSLPEEMKIEGADGYIKFALGENVKQSNWGDNRTTRFPQTRMGVEQVYEDHFTRANQYAKDKKTNEDTRVDLELEALQEIIEKKRFISCHSYVQSEITMLMRIAEKYGFTLNTFTHILEGYKVADKMKEHGAGASTFSDWWAYKYEVMDAIPYNARILDAMDIPVAINSDDAEMGRRLNQEAAKGVKYGGMSEESAWNMVTLNPAKLLHIDDRTGSIKVGKDADLVLWTDHPMSMYAKVVHTYVDGKKLYDQDRDVEMRKLIREQKAALMAKMVEAKEKGEKTQLPIRMPRHHYHCGDLDCNRHIDYNVDLNFELIKE